MSSAVNKKNEYDQEIPQLHFTGKTFVFGFAVVMLPKGEAYSLSHKCCRQDFSEISDLILIKLHGHLSIKIILCTCGT